MSSREIGRRTGSPCPFGTGRKPRVCHVHYPALAPIVEATCREYGVRYSVHQSFRAGLASHYPPVPRRDGRPGEVEDARAGTKREAANQVTPKALGQPGHRFPYDGVEVAVWPSTEWLLGPASAGMAIAYFHCHLS